MSSLLFRLPTEVLSLIYQYDNTYKEKFTDNVMSMIWGRALKHSIKTISLPITSYFGVLSYEKQISKGTVAVQYAALHLFKMMGFLDNYVKNKTCLYGFGNNFHIDDLTAICIELDDYVVDTSSLNGDNYVKRNYSSIILYLKSRKVFDGVIYTDIGENDNDDNENIMMVNYNSETRTALYQYIG